MSNHVTLTDDERKDVVGFWADYFRSSGEGRQPTAFQLDAINDPDVRDAFLFWQIGCSDPTAYNPRFSERPEVQSLIELFGDNPTGDQMVDATRRLIHDNTVQGVEMEDLDTGSIWILGVIMWQLLGGAWLWACDEAEKLATITKQADELPDNKYPHHSPVIGIGMSTALLSLHAVAGGDDHALDLAAQMYGFDENHPNTRWARNAYARVRAERIKNEAA